MAKWIRGIKREISTETKKTLRWVNRSPEDVSSFEVLTVPAGLTVSSGLSGQNIDVTISGGDEGVQYEIGPKITFSDSDIDYYPIFLTVVDYSGDA